MKLPPIGSSRPFPLQPVPRVSALEVLLISILYIAILDIIIGWSMRQLKSRNSLNHVLLTGLRLQSCSSCRPSHRAKHPHHHKVFQGIYIKDASFTPATPFMIKLTQYTLLTATTSSFAFGTRLRPLEYLVASQPFCHFLSWGRFVGC